MPDSLLVFFPRGWILASLIKASVLIGVTSECRKRFVQTWVISGGSSAQPRQDSLNYSADIKRHMGAVICFCIAISKLALKTWYAPLVTVMYIFVQSVPCFYFLFFALRHDSAKYLHVDCLSVVKMNLCWWLTFRLFDLESLMPARSVNSSTSYFVFFSRAGASKRGN